MSRPATLPARPRGDTFFDYTLLAQRIGLMFLVYFIAWLPFGLVAAVVGGYSDHAALVLWHVWTWVPVVFVGGSLVLVVDLVRRLRNRTISRTQVVGHRAAGCFMVFGTLFGLSGAPGHAPIFFVALALCVVLFAAPRRNALPETPGSAMSHEDRAAAVDRLRSIYGRPSSDPAAAELARSAYLHLRGGMAYSALSWLLVVGLMVMYYGSTSGETHYLGPLKGEVGSPVVGWIVVVGWAIVAVAVLASAAYLLGFWRFCRDVRLWLARQSDPLRPMTRVEERLMTPSTFGSSGALDSFVWGGILFPPLGISASALALIPLLVSLGDGSGSKFDRVELWVALAATLVVAAGLLVVPVGLVWLRGPVRASRATVDWMFADQGSG